MANCKIKRGDKVLVIAGKDKGKEGKVLVVDKAKSRVIVQGVNMVSKHSKANPGNPQGGIVHMEAPIHISNVMYLFKGETTRIGYQIEEQVIDGKVVKTKRRIARPSGELID